ncbi:hypothetical protein OHB02_19010 [Streptomyces albidoflavus]|uniref:hypothetical protein n=1 Tax=Streptomyces TaxID=1883 RepID=UPI001E4C5EB8|nr:hypothetical protein [Streptomyces sp. OUCMDZ-3434]WSB22153.1 hypothetical protein OHB02_19010 [Streptomyces albidoflavus]
MADQRGLPKGTRLTAKASEQVIGMAGRISVADALNAVSQLVSATRESIQIHETEGTKREKLRTYRETEVARIKASEKTLRNYFDLVFEERRETHKRLFDSLDRALEFGDVAAIQTVVGGIVEVARTSPLAMIGNLGELRRAMDDPDTVFEF